MDLSRFHRWHHHSVYRGSDFHSHVDGMACPRVREALNISWKPLRGEDDYKEPTGCIGCRMDDRSSGDRFL